MEIGLAAILWSGNRKFKMKVDVSLYIYYWKRRVFIATSVDFAEESIGLIPGKPLSISEILMIIMIGYTYIISLGVPTFSCKWTRHDRD